MRYQNKRGGHVELQDIQKPEEHEWGSSLDKVNQALLELHKLAMEKEDPQRCDFLESEFLEEQAKAIEQLGDHIANLKCLEVPQNGLGEYLFEWLTWGNSS
uniref:Ferritin n=1 Tax=Varanus komodoensis TaxID=61221 RepID=A0A8D2LXU9_VARKO